jgi:hypothetical protein
VRLLLGSVPSASDWRAGGCQSELDSPSTAANENEITKSAKSAKNKVESIAQREGEAEGEEGLSQKEALVGGADKADQQKEVVERGTEVPPKAQEWEESFDELILACPADVALRLLGDGASFWERHILAQVEYFRDLSVTHCDERYMAKHFEPDGQAMYFIKTYREDTRLLEMGFDLSAYQSALAAGVDPSQQQSSSSSSSSSLLLSSSSTPLPPSPPPSTNSNSRRVFQTIFLDQRRQTDLWPVQEIDQSLVLDSTWWSAFSHTCRHFRWVVPWVWLLHTDAARKKRHTLFCGSWTLFNTHDIAVVSGLAAAERLGADYPFAENALATQAFDTYFGVAHMARRRSKPGCCC